MNRCSIPQTEIKHAHTLFYTPFQDLERVPKGSNTSLGDASVKAIEQHIDEGRWYDARATSAELIKTSLQGLRYLQTCVTLQATTIPLLLIILLQIRPSAHSHHCNNCVYRMVRIRLTLHLPAGRTRNDIHRGCTCFGDARGVLDHVRYSARSVVILRVCRVSVLFLAPGICSGRTSSSSVASNGTSILQPVPVRNECRPRSTCSWSTAEYGRESAYMAASLVLVAQCYQ